MSRRRPFKCMAQTRGPRHLVGHAACIIGLRCRLTHVEADVTRELAGAAPVLMPQGRRWSEAGVGQMEIAGLKIRNHA